jgi:hypothetical protein
MKAASLMKPTSKRFSPTRLAERLVPVLLIILALVLVATLVIIGLAVAGIVPGG